VKFDKRDSGSNGKEDGEESWWWLLCGDHSA
jgi:hypothetical protein